MKKRFKIDWAGGPGTAIIVGAIIAAALCVVGPFLQTRQARAQNVVTQALQVVPLGYCQLSAAQLAAAIGLAACAGGIPSGTTMAFLQAETANVRYRDDGVAPTAAVGNIIFFGAGGSVFYAGTLTRLQFILATGSPLLNVAFYR